MNARLAQVKELEARAINAVNADDEAGYREARTALGSIAAPWVGNSIKGAVYSAATNIDTAVIQHARRA